MSYARLILVSTSALALLAAAAPAARAQTAVPTTNKPPASGIGKNGLEEVVVTARRRSERAQTTPIAITAFSSATLAQKSINQVQDLNEVVPGFRFSNEGGKNTNDVILRGLSRIPIGQGTPAVVTYFADVPLPGLGSNIPVFDLSNVQVLKGPQGTLFGRNTLGGAVLLSPTPPSDKFGGYIDAQFGNYANKQIEGALNIPIIADKVDLRIAGHYRREDGYVKVLNGDGAFSDINENAYRISLLVRPTSYIKSTTIYDYMTAPENSFGGYLISANPNQVGALSPLIDPQIAAYAAQQHAAGPQTAFSDNGGTGRAFRRLQGVTNDTRVDLTDDLTIRNIVGYRKAYNNQLINSGANGPLTVTIPGVGTAPFTLFDAAEVDNQEYLTDEVQVLGKSFNNRLSWIIGGFYNHDDSLGGTGSNFVAFSSPLLGSNPAGSFTTSHTEDTNEAVYVQGGLDLSGWVLNGLTFNGGFRYSFDKVHACGGTFPGGYVDSATCEANAALNIPGLAGDVNAAQSQPSWTIGFDYKYSPKQFFYIVTRRGYRGVNVNTPLFSSPYTTGGIVPPSFPGAQDGCSGPGNVCPDLRPFQKTGPEKLTDVEIGSKTDFTIAGMSARLDIDGYYSKYQNALQFFNVLATGISPSAPDLPNNQSVGINAADENILGAELAFTIKPIETLTISLNGSYTNADITKVSSPSTTGLSLSKSQITLPSPLFSGTASITWTPDFHPLQGDLILNGDWYQSGHFGAQYGKTFPGYGVGNVRIALNHIENTGFDLAVFAKNIADRKYLIGPDVLLPTFPVSVGYYAPPRQYGVELRYSF